MSTPSKNTVLASEPAPTVLVVDDNESNRELILAYLEPLAVRTQIAADGLEALAKVGAGQPDLILLDIMMPKMSGFEVCRRLKSDPVTRDIPIIMITALNEISDIERAAECGTNEYISKPINKTELQLRVKNMLDLYAHKRKLEQTLKELGATNP